MFQQAMQDFVTVLTLGAIAIGLAAVAFVLFVEHNKSKSTTNARDTRSW